ATRVSAGRSPMGATSIFANDADAPPGPAFTLGTPGVLPFFVTLQRALPGTFSADVTVAYSLAELAVAGIAPGSSAERDLVLATFNPGTCMMGGAPCAENGDCGANGPCVGTSYTPFVDTAIATAAHGARAAGVTHFSAFAVLPATLFSTLVRGGGPRRSDCRAEWQVVNPTNTPFRDAQGEVSGLQTCRDGDATCDGDGAADGVCTFRLAVCLNPVDEGAPTCTAEAVAASALARPTRCGGAACRSDHRPDALGRASGCCGNSRTSCGVLCRLRPARAAVQRHGVKARLQAPATRRSHGTSVAAAVASVRVFPSGP